MTQREERFEIDIHATPAEVWDRLTTAEGLASWFGTTAEIDLRVGGSRTIGWGDTAEMEGTIEAIEPERRLRVVYLIDGEPSGAEEWIIASDSGTVRLTLIQSMSDEGIDDWEGFFGDIERGWRLFMASMRFALEDAATPNREVECRAVPAPMPAQEIWDKVGMVIDASDLVVGLEPALLIPPHSRLLVAADRSLLLDVEGSGDGRVLYVQAATHGGPGQWRHDVVELFGSALG